MLTSVGSAGSCLGVYEFVAEQKPLKWRIGLEFDSCNLGNPSHPANIATPATRPTCFLHHLLHYPCTKASCSCQAALLCSSLSKHLRLLLFLVVSGRVGSSPTLMRCTSPTKASHSSNVLIEGERPPNFSQCNELKEKQMLVHCIGKDFHQEQFHQVYSFSTIQKMVLNATC